MNKPLVSIITPTYNHEKYISDCINSVLEQTYENWELIIIDDGSTDDTFRIAEKAALKDARIKAFTQSNVGIFRLGETYNFALSQSSGKYIAVLEGDDVWMPQKLEIQLQSLEENEHAVLSWGKAYASKSDLSEHYNLYPIVDRGIGVFTNTPVKTALTQLIYANFIPALTVLIRKSSLMELGGFIQNHNLPLIDMPTWQQLARMGTFTYVNEPLGNWRIYPTQVTKTYTAQMAEGFYELAVELYQQDRSYFEVAGIKISAINRYYRKLLVVNYSRSGRYKLIRADFAGARKDYLKSIFCFGFHEPLWKVRSMIGFLFSLFKLNIEGFTRKLGRVSYQ